MRIITSFFFQQAGLTDWMVDSLEPSDAIWWHSFESTALFRVMVWRQQTITWPDVDLLSNVYRGIRQR